MRQRIYIDTSVIGGYWDEEFETPTRMLFGRIAARPAAYKGWKLPTNTENQTFVGAIANGGAYDNVNASVSPGTWAAATPGFATFLKSGNTQLPAVGNRNADGTVANQGQRGYFWSSTFNSANSHSLSFAQGYVTKSDNLNRVIGRSIRCVR